MNDQIYGIYNNIGQWLVAGNRPVIGVCLIVFLSLLIIIACIVFSIKISSLSEGFGSPGSEKPYLLPLLDFFIV